MTALEMAEKFKWVDMTVHFCGGHVSIDGATRIVNGDHCSVWVGKVCLNHDTIVSVRETIGKEGAKVSVYRSFIENAA
jgi:hypothetical protein